MILNQEVICIRFDKMFRLFHFLINPAYFIIIIVTYIEKKEKKFFFNLIFIFKIDFTKLMCLFSTDYQ